MQWRPEYALGIKEIDNQHKHLLRCFTRIEDSITSKQPWSATHFTISDLRDAAQAHFRFEESMMRLFGYSDTAEHARLHQKMEMQLRLIETSSVTAPAHEVLVIRFLRDWLTDHICKSDNDYARFILSGATVVQSDVAGFADKRAA